MVMSVVTRCWMMGAGCWRGAECWLLAGCRVLVAGGVPSAGCRSVLREDDAGRHRAGVPPRVLPTGLQHPGPSLRYRNIIDRRDPPDRRVLVGDDVVQRIEPRLEVCHVAPQAADLIGRVVERLGRIGFGTRIGASPHQRGGGEDEDRAAAGDESKAHGERKLKGYG